MAGTCILSTRSQFKDYELTKVLWILLFPLSTGAGFLAVSGGQMSEVRVISLKDHQVIAKLLPSDGHKSLGSYILHAIHSLWSLTRKMETFLESRTSLKIIYSFILRFTWLSYLPALSFNIYSSNFMHLNWFWCKCGTNKFQASKFITK